MHKKLISTISGDIGMGLSLHIISWFTTVAKICVEAYPKGCLTENVFASKFCDDFCAKRM